MTDKINTPVPEEKDAVEKVTGFWNQYSKQILIALGAIVVIVGGFFAYQNFVSGPNERKASEAIRFAEDYYRKDSLKLALNGDAINPGFVKVASKYSGTKAGNLANFYAGSCYLGIGDFNNAIKYLEQFSTSEPLVKARAKALLGDAKAELGKKEEAVALYKEAGTTFEKDDFFSPKYLFRAAYLYETMGKNKEALETYKMIKEKYPQFRDYDIDKLMGRLGATE
ncbi:MAG: tetratricopeptide repeat protein [Bacteroidota bacterium]|nr:tetratricopeptide repeat protein [Bacteroidota bacterium]